MHLRGDNDTDKYTDSDSVGRLEQVLVCESYLPPQALCQEDGKGAQATRSADGNMWNGEKSIILV
jgi:hypothetical protein